MNFSDIKKDAFFYKGKCMFCGKKSDERYFSGSYETYEDCECEERKRYYEYRKLAHVEECKAEERYKIIIMKQDLEDAKKKVEYLTNEIDRQCKIRNMQ